jgi:hypothetical protein
MLLGKTSRQGLPTPGLGPGQQCSASPPTQRLALDAMPAMLKATRWPPPDVRPVGAGGRRPKDHILDPCAKVLDARALLCLPPRLIEQLLHNIHPKGFSGRVSEHGLCGGRQRHPKRIELPFHLGMAGVAIHILFDRWLRTFRGGKGATMVRHNLNHQVCRRVSSSTRSSHYLSASSRHRLALIALSDTPWKFASAMSRVWCASMNSPSRRATL